MDSVLLGFIGETRVPPPTAVNYTLGLKRLILAVM